MNYKKIQYPLFYIGTFFSGFAALVYQVVWQRYLAILIGSEAKSSAIVISIFLIGLALGYYVFGKLMEKDWSRYQSMKFYGYVELVIAIYALMFPILFQSFKSISFAGPNLLVFDIFIVGLCILFPTFLMGGSIPILTTVMPNKPEEVNSTHAKIYGWNTLGACLGVFLGGFYLMPTYGLPYSMLIAGFINFLLSFIFLANRLEGQAHQLKSVTRIENILSDWMVYLLVFVVGVITISLEVVLMRIVGLSIGSSNMVFPIVLSIFIFGLGLGSLNLPDLKNSNGLYLRLASVAALWSLVFLTVPFWGFWVSHIKVSLTTLPSNYFIFYFLILLMLFVIFFLPVFLLGQVLPIAYSLLDKTGEDYGKKCGYLYSCNTIGTAVGGIVFGYLLLYFVDLEMTFRLNILILALVCGGFAFYESKNKYALAAGLVFLFMIFPNWNRVNHVFGVFRIMSADASMFKGFFSLAPQKNREILYFTDGPNSTVSIIRYPETLKSKPTEELLKTIGLETSVAVIMNGKSDGDTIGDFSTMYLTGALPYFFSNKTTDLTTAVVGFGTGLSAGVLVQSKDVKEVDLLEISYELLQGREFTKGANYGADQHEKMNYIHTDAFRHFTRLKNKYDLIVTEPSNPWVTGVENLFTFDFLELAESKLNEDGILAMWFQRYDSDNTVIKAILSSVVNVFDHYQVYEIGVGDSLILMSNKPLNLQNFESRSNEDLHKKVLSYLKVKDSSDLLLMRSLNEKAVKLASLDNTLGVHSLEFPKLSDISNKFRFQGIMANVETLMSLEFDILVNDTNDNIMALNSVLKRAEDFKECSTFSGLAFYCRRVQGFFNHMLAYKNPKPGSDIQTKFLNYMVLRRYGFVANDPEIVAKSIDDKIEKLKTFTDFDKKSLSEMFKLGLVDNLDSKVFESAIEKVSAKFGAEDEKFMKDELDRIKQHLMNAELVSKELVTSTQ